MQRFHDFFLFRYQYKDYVEFSQARLTFNFCLVTALFSLLYVLIANLIDFQISTLVMPILAVLFMGLAFLIRTGISLRTISFLYLLLSFVSAIILVYFSGMIYSSIIPWLSFIPLSANLLINRRTAVLWMFVCFIAVFAFAYLQENYSEVSVGYEKKYEVLFYAIVYNGLTAIILTLSMVFQKAKDSVLTTLQKKNELISSINLELKAKNNEIIAQNEELLQQKEEITAQREFIETKNRELLLIQDELNGLIEKLTHTQNALAGREAENRSILDAIYNTRLLVGELDLDGRVVKISPEVSKFLQMPEEEILGKTFDEIEKKVKGSIEGNLDFRDVWRGLLQGKNFSFKAMFKINGEEVSLKENFFPILSEHGKTSKVMVVAQNISQSEQPISKSKRTRQTKKGS